ncbi:MAG TPA: hypothetical protein ENG59_02805 [Chloroflexi bacterium]|nr:MAG: hypothetical protein DRI46_03975 [Chloroflexota bacterium]HDD55155.1 hypothetical protein [Chloroflexota bacterium]
MQTLSVLLFAVLSLAALVASLIFIRGLFPVRVDRVRQTLENNWKRSFWIGLLNTVLITIFVLGLGSLGEGAPIFYIPTFGIYGAFLIGLLYGLAAFIGLLGDWLFPDQPPVKKDIRASAVFLLASLLPFVGWFLLFPYGISLGVGAVIITLFQNRRSKRNEEDPE